MKKLFSIFLMAFVALAVQAQKQVVWEQPSAFMGRYNSEFKITKVELKPTETVLHITANYTPHYWIRFDKNSFLRTPDGTKYGITSGMKTNDNETDLLLDSLFWMPASGTADLALHFKPVPLETKEMDFSEGDYDEAFRFWNICDSKSKKKLVLPTEWQKVKYAKDETLPVAKINKGVATIKVKMLGYRPDMKMEFFVSNFTPLGKSDHFEKVYPFAADGTVTAEIPLWLAREVLVGVNGMTRAYIIIAPGQETSILMNASSDAQPILAFKGFLAKTNMDLVNEQAKNTELTMQELFFDGVSKCTTAEERLDFVNNSFKKRVAYAKSSKYTTAAKDLICMDAECEHLSWTKNFVNEYTNLQMRLGKVNVRSNAMMDSLYRANQAHLTFPAVELAYSFQYLNEPGSPCSNKFWNIPLFYLDKKAAEKNAFNCDLQRVPYQIAGNTEAIKVLGEIESEECKAVVRDYHAEQERIAQQLGNGESIFYQKFDDVAPENILQTILDRYKGKVVLIDIWATWCGPCKAGHQAMKPWKQELKGKNIQFVYITSTSSPLATWQEMIKDIDGDHYYLTKEQYNYILSKYESTGIPTYAIYDTNGQQSYKTIGFSGIDIFKSEVAKVLK